MNTERRAKQLSQRLARKGAANGKTGAQGLQARGVGQHEEQKLAAETRRNGESGSQEMASPFGSRAVSSGNISKSRNNKKLRFCMYHLQGACKYTSERCAYAHSIEEIRTARGSFKFGDPGREMEASPEGTVEPPGDSRTSSSQPTSAGSPCRSDVPPGLLSAWSGPASAAGRTTHLFPDTPCVQDGQPARPLTRGRPDTGSMRQCLGQPAMSPPVGVDISSQPMYIPVPRLGARQPYPGGVGVALGEVAHVGRNRATSMGDCGCDAFAEEQMTLCDEWLSILTAMPQHVPGLGLRDLSGQLYALGR